MGQPLGDGEAATPLLWSRGSRRALGWLLVVSVVLPMLVGGVLFFVDGLFS